MKKLSLWSAIFCLLLTASTALAQEKAADFAGTWELDAAKSKLGERARIESGTLTVVQMNKNLSVVTEFRRLPRPDGDGSGMRQGGNGMGGGRGAAMMGGGNGTVTYSLDGHETIVEPENPSGMPSSRTKLKAGIEKDGKLKLNSSRTINGQMGEMTITTKETWELLDNGKALKITRETETPRGSQASEMYFTRKDSINLSTVGSIGTYQEPALTVQGDSSASNTPREITAGVLNGKARSLVAPEYPPAARAVRAAGAVNVQVTIDEQGKIVSAAAISGHPLLRAAAEKAARQSEFAPTLLSGVPVKVTGIIVYSFAP